MELNFAAKIIDALFRAKETLEKSRFSPNYFTRQRKMPFVDVLYFILNPARECLQVRLDNFVSAAGKPFERVSEQALSRARNHFDHTPFEKAAHELVLKEYSGDYPLPTMNGYHILVADGSIAPLPSDPALFEEYGKVNSAAASPALGISLLTDVLHHFVLDASPNHARFAERPALLDHARYLRECLPHIADKSLILLDRGYASADVAESLDRMNIKFLARCPSTWNALKSAPMGRSTRSLKNGLRVQVFKFFLPSAEVETLITNAFDLLEIGPLYRLRWGIEGRFDTLKNKIQLENFTGKTKNAILQDFWASVTLANLAAIAFNQAHDIADDQRILADNRYTYIPNISQMIASFKDDFIIACSSGSTLLINRIIRRVAKAVVPVRPGRHFPRKNGIKKRQFPINRKTNA